MKKSNTTKIKRVLLGLMILLLVVPVAKITAEAEEMSAYELPVIMIESENTVELDDYEDAEISVENLTQILRLEKEPMEWRVRDSRCSIARRSTCPKALA